MVERQDIDALLISALYGELTPAEETRLATHLESHPADRTALADLTHARQIVRDSRILQVQLEPPQSVSAMLMQEAARRAPKGLRDPEQQESWFARFVRSFMAHPAMAAAAMLVIVVGVATMVTREKGDHFADSTAPSMSVAHEQENSPAANGVASGSAASVESNLEAPRGEAAQGSGSADSYPVMLDDGVAAATGEKLDQDKRTGGGKDVAKVMTPAPTTPLAENRPAKNRVTTEGGFATKPDAAKKGTAGIELRSQQYAPKDFDDAQVRKAPPKLAKEEQAEAARDAFGGVADGELSRNDRSGVAVGGAPQPMTTTAPSAPPPPPPVAPPKSEPKREAVTTTATTKTVPRAKAAAPAEDKASDPQLAWAREQHVALINQVRAGDCRKAAGIATTLSNRSPAYYQQNVETDRSVKDCIAYINTEREREAEQRAERARAAQKRTNEPAKASPPAKATTSKPTSADSTK
ncbi:MAG: hypothetical protein JWP01_772 [Myxococcales bacterium]|nr:hypothetical protein [Myxococcales bacterium]